MHGNVAALNHLDEFGQVFAIAVAIPTVLTAA